MGLVNPTSFALQVVKKPTDLSDAFIDSPPSAGSKRSIRDRLGDNGDGSLLYGNQMSSKRCVLDYIFLPYYCSIMLLSCTLNIVEVKL